MDIFGDLESFGIKKMDDVDIYKEEKDNKEEKEKAPASEGKKLNEADFIFDKNMTCPVCGHTFKTKKVRAGKARYLGTDSDLRPLHEGVDTVKYDVIVCLHCGYASLERIYSNITSRQIKEIREQIGYSFKGMTNAPGEYSYDEAIQRYKLALFCCVVRKTKMSERAYICLKIAWLYRGQGQSLNPEMPDYEAKKKECEDCEKSFIEKAYEGFKIAFEKESMPICGMDQYTFSYLMADLARQCRDYDAADRYIYDVIGARSVSAKVKEKARTLHERIRQEREQQKDV